MRDGLRHAPGWVGRFDARVRSGSRRLLPLRQPRGDEIRRGRERRGSCRLLVRVVLSSPLDMRVEARPVHSRQFHLIGRFGAVAWEARRTERKDDAQSSCTAILVGYRPLRRRRSSAFIGAAFPQRTSRRPSSRVPSSPPVSRPDARWARSFIDRERSTTSSSVTPAS